MVHIKHSPTWNFYVGDPCYVIDDERWHEFCAQLSWNPGSSSNVEWEVDGETYDIEVWHSPGGDGVWRFRDMGECGVDAGILAIVPRECCIRDMGDPAGLGIVFEMEPTLETDDNEMWVEINGVRDDSYTECYECGDHIREDMWECDCGMTTGCESCWEGCDDPECGG